MIQSSSKPRILFVAESATLAHVARPCFLASTLPPETYDVHFAADSYYDFVFGQTAFTRHSIFSRSPEDFERVLRAKGVLFDEQLLSRYVADEIKLIEEIRPDVIVGDLRPSLSVSATVSGVPYIALTNAYWSPYAERDGFPLLASGLIRSLRWSPLLSQRVLKTGTSFFQKVLPKILHQQGAGINRVRERYLLEAFPDYLRGYTASDCTLYCDPPSLVPMKNLPPSHSCIGPVSWSPKIPAPEWLHKLGTVRPMVYLSLGSSGDENLLPMLVTALSLLDVDVVASTAGKTFPKDLPNSFFLAEYLPGKEIVRRTTMVITNGGSPSSYQALQAGVPVLGLPVNMDQFLCMERIDAQGSGILLRSDMATVSRIRDAVQKLLRNTQYKTAAGSIQHECQGIVAERSFTAVLNEYTHHKKKYGL